MQRKWVDANYFFAFNDYDNRFPKCYACHRISKVSYHNFFRNKFKVGISLVILLPWRCNFLYLVFNACKSHGP